MVDVKLLAKCGLYCGICTDLLEEKCCLGCGCDCEQCAAHWHHQSCEISLCVDEHGIETCADCPEFPCTKLILFANDPIWTTHRPVIENLRRIQVIGSARWLEEQAAYFSDPSKRKAWIWLHHENARIWQASQGDGSADES